MLAQDCSRNERGRIRQRVGRREVGLARGKRVKSKLGRSGHLILCVKHHHGPISGEGRRSNCAPKCNGNLAGQMSLSAVSGKQVNFGLFLSVAGLRLVFGRWI